MPARRKLETLVVIAVAVVFQWFFMYTKHAPALRPIIPFGDDPYDALGSLTSIVNILLGVLLLVRAFRPYRRSKPSAMQDRYLRRTQAAVLLLILTTLAADAVALARLPHSWIGSPARYELVALVGAMALLAGAALGLILALPGPAPSEATGSRMWMPALLTGSIFVIVLAVYPLAWIDTLIPHLFTCIVGDLLLFVPVAILTQALLPDTNASAAAARQRSSPFAWAGATLAAILIGAWLFLAEMMEGGPPSLRMRLLVASVYIGLVVAGVLIALACLWRPLGLGRRAEAV